MSAHTASDAHDPRPRSRLTPRVRRDVLADRAAFRLAAGRGSMPDPALLERVREEVTHGLAVLDGRGWLDAPSTYHEDPPPPDGIRTRRTRAQDVRYTSLTWLDRYEVRAAEPGATRYAGYAGNRVARAAVLEHRSEDRPWLLCLHGFGMGSAGMDLHAMRALHLHRDLGLNLAFLTLPFHGRRKPAGTRMPPVPGADMLDNLHGLAQAVWDARQLLRHLRERTEQPIGVMGLSLGGCVAALTASLDVVDAALLLVPVADLGSVIAEATLGSEAPVVGSLELVDDARRLLEPVSPLALEPRVPADRRFIVAGTLDRFVPPTSQAVALWRHWDQPQVHWFHGGHVSMFWNRGVQPAIDTALRRFGLA